jgi:uncharacterized protein (TIGR03067 family)
MNLFGELLFASDHPDPRRFDASESQPVPADDCFKRLHNHVTNAGVQVEAGKDPVNSEASAKNQEAKPGNANDAKMLQGEWRIVDMEMDGKVSRRDVTGAPIIFTGDELSFADFFGPEKMKFRLDSGKSPRELHLTLANGKFKGKTIRCIYSLENGELKLCLPSPETRATEFKTKADTKLYLVTYKRKKK